MKATLVKFFRFKFGSSDMEMLYLNSYEDYLSLPLNKWNIRQPSDDDIREDVFNYGSLDLIIAPGLGFSPDGRRLGRGKGYYDRFIKKCCDDLKRKPYIIGLALKEQVVDDIPTSEYDEHVDEVLTA